MLQKEKGSLEREFISVGKMLMKGLRLVHCGYQQLLLIEFSF